jgi:hypothetical protein
MINCHRFIRKPATYFLDSYELSSMSSYELKFRKAEKEPRPHKKSIHKFICRRKEAEINLLFTKKSKSSKADRYFPMLENENMCMSLWIVYRNCTWVT